MFGQFTEALQTSADLGFFGNKLNSLFANDYIEMLGVQERNIDKLTNLHNGLLQKITKIEDSNGKEFLEGVMEELTTGRNNQIETYEKNLSYINTEVAKANAIDRKSTRLNSSHGYISYAVFCLRKEEHTSELQSRLHLV